MGTSNPIGSEDIIWNVKVKVKKNERKRRMHDNEIHD
jgi:hypothetical protein